MSISQGYVITVIAIPLILVATDRLRSDVAALMMAFLLGAGQFAGLSVLGPANTPDDAVNALNGLGRPVIWTLISLFILTDCLDKYGVTRWIASRILRLGSSSERRMIALFTLAAVLLSLVMNNVAAGALLLPSAIDAARRAEISPSKLLMPVAFGTLLGGGATYFTTANIIVSGLLTTANPPQKSLGILDFTPTGGLIAAAGIAFITWFGPRLLPDRPAPNLAVPSDISDISEMGDLDFRRRGAVRSVVLISASVLASILGVPVYLAVLGGAIAVILDGLMSFEEAFTSVEWRAVMIVAGMYPVSTALVQTGLAQAVGEAVVSASAPFGPLGLAAGVYLLTMALVQVMGGQVTALVTGPIAISAALHFNVSPQAIAVVTAIACSASYLTPVAHPVNTLMIVPGNYRFGDFFRLGWGLTLVSFIMLLVGMKLFWAL